MIFSRIFTFKNQQISQTSQHSFCNLFHSLKSLCSMIFFTKIIFKCNYAGNQRKFIFCLTIPFLSLMSQCNCVIRESPSKPIEYFLRQLFWLLYQGFWLVIAAKCPGASPVLAPPHVHPGFSKFIQGSFMYFSRVSH